MGVADATGRRCRRPAWCAAVALLLAACAVRPFEPLRVEVPGGLPADAFARCRDCLSVRYQRLVLVDEAGFRLRTDWVAGPDPDVASQRRASLFRSGASIACVVEARYLTLGWFASLPQWSSPRADADGERELGALLAAALAPLPAATGDDATAARAHSNRSSR